MKTSTFTTAEQIEAKIASLKERQKFEAIEEGGAGVHYTAEYYIIEDQIAELYDRIDELYEQEKAAAVFKTQEQIDIETKIKNLSDRQREIQSNGLMHLTAEYFNIDAELDSLFDQLDEIIKQPVGVTEEEIAAIRYKATVENFEIMKIGESLFRVNGFWYGVKEPKMKGNAAAVAKWINEYTGKRTPIKQTEAGK